MKRSIKMSIAAASLAAAGVAAGERLDRALAPDVIEGSLAAAECVVTTDATAACQRRALDEGRPGGIVTGEGFTLLLVDGRILGRTCAAGTPGRLRASGVLHQGGSAMSLFRLEENCGAGWTTVDLPHTGTMADGAGGGDE